jgi:hypothetical protein
MRRVLRWHVASEMTARRFGWGAGFLLLLACTFLVSSVLPELGTWTSIGLVSCLAWGCVRLGAQLPKVVRA